MKQYVVLAGVVLLLVLVSGCTEQSCPDCNCNQTNQTACDCNRTGFDEVKVSGSLTVLYPKKMCELYPEYCNLENATGWAGKYGIPVKTYDAEWAQAPIYLLYGDTEVAILDSASRLSFLTDLCKATNASVICSDVNGELNSSKTGMTACVEAEGYEDNMIAFYFSQTCPHCTRMKPWVQELENQSYRFIWIDAGNETSIKFAAKCLPTLIKLNEGVPQFGCIKSGERQLGAFETQADMLSFVKKCVG